jgi:hypothetical protein
LADLFDIQSEVSLLSAIVAPVQENGLKKKFSSHLAVAKHRKAARHLFMVDR